MVTTTPAPSRCWCLVSRWHEAQYRKIWGQAGLIRVSSEALTLVLLSLSLCSGCPLMSCPMRTILVLFRAFGLPRDQPAQPGREPSRKNPPGLCEQPRLRSQTQLLAAPNGSPKDTGLEDALGRPGRPVEQSCVLRASIGRARDRYQNFLAGILLSGRNVHQITYNFQRPRFAPENVGTS